MELGRAHQWRDLLNVYQKEKSAFNDVNYSTILVQLGRIPSTNTNDPTLLRLLQDIAQQDLTTFAVRSLANLAYAQARLGLQDNMHTQQFFLGLDGARLFRDGNTQEIANTLWACAKLDIYAPDLLDRLDQHSSHLLQHGNPQEIANTVWACGTLGVHAPILFAELDRQHFRLETAKPQEVGNTVWAYAKLGIPAPHLLAAVDQQSDTLLANGNTQEIANTLWAFAKLGTPAPRLLDGFDQRSQVFLREGNSQDLANVMWACATLGVEAPRLFAGLDAHCEKIVQGNPQELANTLWACAKLNLQAPILFEQLDQHSSNFLKNGNAQEIANTIWACATLDIQAPKLYAALDAHTFKVLEQGEAQEIANTLWACATLDLDAPQLYAGLDQQSQKILGDGGATQAIANTLWACAKLGLHAPQLCAGLDPQAHRLLHQGSTQDIANTAWACATLSTQSPELFAGLESQSDKILGEGNIQEIGNIVWAMAYFNRLPKSLISRLYQMVTLLLEQDQLSLDFACTVCWLICQVATDELAARDPDTNALFQCLWQYILESLVAPGDIQKLTEDNLSKVCAMDTVGSLLGLEVLLRLPPFFYDYFPEQTSQPSRSQMRLSRALANMGFAHECELSPFPHLANFMAIDIALEEDTKKIAIEFDGPAHFYRYSNCTLSHDYNVPTLFKHRVLEALGWTVISIDFRVAHSNSYSPEWLATVLEEHGATGGEGLIL